MALLALDKGNILLGPAVDLLLELGISIGGRRDTEGAAARGNIAKVGAVSLDVEAASAGVAVNVVVARADLDLVEGVGIVVGGLGDRQPVLRGGVAVVEGDGGQTGDGVVKVGDAVLRAGLGGDEVGDDTVSDTGGAVGVDVDGVAVGTEVGTANGGNSTTERVAGDHDTVGRIGGQRAGDGAGDASGQLVPGIMEAHMELASGHERGVDKGKVEVGEPVQEVAAATDGNDDLATSVVDGNVAGDASIRAGDGGEHGDAVGLNLGAVAAAGNGAASCGSRVAVGRTGVLNVEGKVVHLGAADLSGLESLGIVLNGHGHGSRQSGG